MAKEIRNRRDQDRPGHFGFLSILFPVCVTNPTQAPRGGNVSMSADGDIAKSEYVTDLYTVTTELIDQGIVAFVGSFD